MEDAMVKTLAWYGLAGVLVAALLWFVRHAMTVLMPNAIASFTNQMNAERSACAEQHKEAIAIALRNHETNCSLHEKTREELQSMAMQAGIKRAEAKGAT